MGQTFIVYVIQQQQKTHISWHPMEMKTFLECNKKEKSTYLKLWDTAEAVLREKLIPIFSVPQANKNTQSLLN
jgi:hypothetical protein